VTHSLNIFSDLEIADLRLHIRESHAHNGNKQVEMYDDQEKTGYQEHDPHEVFLKTVFKAVKRIEAEVTHSQPVGVDKCHDRISSSKSGLALIILSCSLLD
jgi:hypothetical protein